ncbi:MAG: hypothetical protein ACR2MS_10680 [Weeksellaceae bacterium]
MSREIDLHTIRNRPRFKIKTNLSREEIKMRLARQFHLQKTVLGGYIGDELSVIYLRNEKDKFWTPQLQIRTEVDEVSKDITYIRGLFGPKPAIWTFFIFLYTLGGTIFGFFAMIWFVQLRLNVASNLIIWAWIGLAIILGTYMAALIGRRMAKRHMKVLKDFMEKVVNDELEDDVRS